MYRRRCASNFGMVRHAGFLVVLNSANVKYLNGLDTPVGEGIPSRLCLYLQGGVRRVVDKTSIASDGLGRCGNHDLDVRDDRYKQSQVRGGAPT
jgi:hypothetical protein